MNISESIRTLRNRKGVSQEKLANYLNVSFQAVSKWETGAALPDITLLPEIACFFDVTVDELLQVKALDENRLYRDYYDRAAAISENGQSEQLIALWKEALHKMPNRIDVKEKLLCSYFDHDRAEYADEIIELGMEIYSYKGEFPLPDDIHNGAMYYQSQAVRILALTYYALGKTEMSEDWARKAAPIYNCQDILFAETSDGDAMLRDGSFCVYWFLKELFHFAARIVNDTKSSMRIADRIDACREVISIYETIYNDGDMGCDSCSELCQLHLWIARLQAALDPDDRDAMIRKHLICAIQLAKKTISLTPHTLTHPLMHGIDILTGSSERLPVMVKDTLSEEVFHKYSDLLQQFE